MKLLYMSANPLLAPGNLTIESTDWEVARDSNFAQLIFRDHDNKERILWNSFSTNEEPPMHARCRFRTSGGPTEWTTALLGTSYVKTPGLTLTKETIAATDYVAMRGTAFDYIGDEITHSYTEWFLFDPDNVNIYNRVSVVPETEHYVPASVFNQPGTYTVKLRYVSGPFRSSLAEAKITL